MDENNSLFQRVVRGGVWVFALRIVGRIFDLIRIIILARILVPHDFGLIGIALLIIASLETFSRTGFQQALIQKKNNIESYLDAAWTVLVLRGFILFVILYLSAPYVALFFKSPGAKIVIQVIGISILLQAFHNIGVIYFQKELEFNKQFIYQLSGTLADFIVAISCALILKNAWALVFGLLARDFVRFIVSYLIHPYRPVFRLNLEKIKELFGFGKWILGSSILIFLVTQGGDILVGRLLGVTMLGFYQMAYKISNMPVTEITHVISQVAFPAYSKLQDNMPRLREAYLKVLQFTAFLSFPIAGLIFVLAPDFTKIFLGEKWMPMVQAMQVLALSGLVRSITATAGSIFHAVGRPKIDTRWQVVRLSVLAALIYLFIIKWGILGASIAVFLSLFVSNIGFTLAVIRITKCGIKKFAGIILFPLINIIITVFLISGLKTIIGTGIGEFIILVCMGVLMYFIMTYLSAKFFGYKMQVFRILRESLQSK